MRTLSAPLLAEQKKTSRRPAVKVRIRDLFGGVRRVRASATFYTGAEPEGPHAAACDADGSLLRLRVEANTLYRQLVTTPTSGDTYTSWTSFRTTTSLGAVAWCGSYFLAVAVDSGTPTQVYANASADGITWFGWALAFTHAVSVTSIALAGEDGGSACVVLNNGNNITARKFDSVSWAAAITTADGALTPTGLAVVYRGDWHVIATGTAVTGGASRVASRVMGNGAIVTNDTWNSYSTVIEAPTSAQYTYSAPFLARPDTTRLTLRENYTGTGANDRVTYAHMPPTADPGPLFREPVPFNTDRDDYGLAIAYNSTTMFLCCSSRIYAVNLAIADIDVTADVLSVDMPDAALGDDPTTIVISNARGTYDGPPDPIERGSQVQISPGYSIAGTPTYSDGPAVWIERVERSYRGNPDTLTLSCRPLGWWLARWRTMRTLTYTARNPFQILQDLFARIGFEFSATGASAAASSLSLTLTIPAGTSGKDAVRRILDRIPDTIYSRAEFAFLNKPLAADAAVATYEYRGTPGVNHPLTGSVFVTQLKPHAHVRVIGGAQANVLGEYIDYGEAALAYSSARSLHDRDATTAGIAGDRAEGITRAYEREANDDLLIAAVHCGLEVNDVIAVTDSRAGLSAATRRVRGLRLRYRRRQTAIKGRRAAVAALYEHHITVSAP